ncbi:MAG: BatA domain-containing protein [Planctomycetaceae bacterium]|nr:BatA domain-containing protein [Planctomycetaceae bacterium]
MALINATLLAGLALAAVPVVLHLLMRAKPKRIEFPALRLLRTRQTANSRRMRLRHILLLILRTAVIAVAVLALTRPSLPAAQYGLRWYEWMALAAVVAAAFGVYGRLAQRVSQSERADHLRREKLGRLRAFVLVGALFALLPVVALPWGLRVRGEVTGPSNPLAENTPVAAAFVFDNSLSMTYKLEGRTRLELATQTALQHLTILPQGSRVAVMTAAPEAEVVFQADLAGVKSRVEDLEADPVVRPMNAVLRSVIDAQIRDREQVVAQLGTGDAYSREIYLFTDLSVAGWQDPDESGIHDLLAQHDWLQVYLIDLSVTKPINVSLSQLRLDRQTTGEGQPANVSVTVAATSGASRELTLEVFTIDQNDNEIAGGGGAARRSMLLSDAASEITFPVQAAARAKFQRGFIRLVSPDPLPFDDVRYFCFAVAPVPKVLLVADRPEDSRYLLNAMQPEFMERLGIRRYDCRSVRAAEFRTERPENYDIVCLVNWQRPEPDVWSDLLRYVQAGGSLLVTTGGEKTIQADAWRTPEAAELLPGLPVVKVPFRGSPGQLSMAADSHPIVRTFQEDQDALTELTRALFDLCWTFDLNNETQTLMTFNDRTRRPALMERRVGSGRVLMFSSAVDNLQKGGAQWNEGFVIDNWAFLMFVDECLQYLLGTADSTYNFTAGRPVEVRVSAKQRFHRYVVERPKYRLTEGLLEFDESSVLLTDVDNAGHYRLRSTDDGSTFRSEFSANTADDESDLTVTEDVVLDELFGKDRYSRVTDPAQLQRAVNVGRLGVEVFPVLLGLLILLFCAEHLMANFFYDEVPENTTIAGTVGGT